jgi:hypothetical protein
MNGAILMMFFEAVILGGSTIVIGFVAYHEHQRRSAVEQLLERVRQRRRENRAL